MIHVINLIGREGNFETDSAGQPVGTRTFGLWSRAEPKEGELIVIGRGSGKVCYEVVGSARPFFTGSNGDRYWKGIMRDVNRLELWTNEKIDALKRADLA